MSVATLSETRTFDRTLEFTLSKYLERVRDNYFDHSPLLSICLGRLQNAQFGAVSMNGRAKMMHGGGESIVIRHNLGNNTTAQTLAGPWATVDTSPSDTVRHSRSNWKHYSGTITLSETDLLINRGPEALSSMLEFETDNAMTSVGDLAGDHLYDNSSDSTRFTDLQNDIVSNSTVQSLNPATYSKFNPRGLSARGTAQASVSYTGGSFAAQGLADMRLMIDNATEGTKRPHAIFTDWTTFGYLKGQVQSQQRFDSASAADVGFANMFFEGIPVFPDAKCPSGEMYALNFDEYKLHVLEGADLSVGPFERAEQQEARVAKVMLKANTAVSDRRFVNKITSITA